MVIEQFLHPQIPKDWSKESALPNHISKFLSGLIEVENLDQLFVLKKASHLAALSEQSLPEGVAAHSPYVEHHMVQPGIFVQERINDVRYINKFMELINEKLPEGGYFIGCVNTAALRKKSLENKVGKAVIAPYHFFDYILHRVIPKLPQVKKAYFAITKGKNRVITEMETYGRLYSCGFTLLGSFVVDGLLYFVAQKVKQPEFNTTASYGPLICLNRTGKNGKSIKVYKLRTMYPYSEYLQEYVYERQGLQDGGKIKDDPRVNPVGKICRKFWIDEIPMLYNLIKGDMKIVGVRPISAHYMSLYPKEFQQYRLGFKPGFIPPFYADLPKTLEEIVASEERYLKAYERNPVITDVKYLCKSLYNVVIKRARSN